MLECRFLAGSHRGEGWPVSDIWGAHGHRSRIQTEIHRVTRARNGLKYTGVAGARYRLDCNGITTAGCRNSTQGSLGIRTALEMLGSLRQCQNSLGNKEVWLLAIGLVSLMPNNMCAGPLRQSLVMGWLRWWWPLIGCITTLYKREDFDAGVLNMLPIRMTFFF